MISFVIIIWFSIDIHIYVLSFIKRHVSTSVITLPIHQYFWCNFSSMSTSIMILLIQCINTAYLCNVLLMTDDKRIWPWALIRRTRWSNLSNVNWLISNNIYNWKGQTCGTHSFAISMKTNEQFVMHFGNFK